MLLGEEKFEVLDQDGNPTGVIKARSHVHRDGDWHRTVHVWITDGDGNLILQKRSATKETYPGLWDISSAGHVEAGSSVDAAAVREVQEELGIAITQKELIRIGQIRQRYCPTDRPIRDCEVATVYVLHRTLKLDSCRIDPDEVDAIRWVSANSLKTRIERNDPLLVPHPEEYPLLFAFLADDQRPAKPSFQD